MGEQYYGAKASMNVWAPRVATQSEFSLSQIWVIAGSFGNDLNTIEAGWQVWFVPNFKMQCVPLS
jgi:Neprosin